MLKQKNIKKLINNAFIIIAIILLVITSIVLFSACSKVSPKVEITYTDESCESIY